MRICLTVHGFPPHERTGVEQYTRSLAAALVRAGHAVEVFARAPDSDLPQLALRREERDGFGVTWISGGREASGPAEILEPPGVASRFGAFLDRERPDLVHFQHVVKLGLGLFAEARRRGIPTVYTAHDYYSTCHRYTLLRPDLERCETVGDPALCARCDVALGHLNGIEALGDYQMGALTDQLSSKERVALARKLESPADDEAIRLRTELDEKRLTAFRGLDRVLAPTRFLRDKLVEGGLEPERVRHLPYGIETGALREVARTRPVREPSGEDAPLRIGFFGGFSKHKGVHVLLEAFGLLRQPAELRLHGLGTDAPYVELLRSRAEEVGAQWRGPYEPEELPELLAEVDVVVVPSLWVENYPIVIREAFAAGRPVLTSRVGALPESVRDGVDGLLFEPGDAQDLARALERCASEEGLLARLAAGIEPVHDIDAQATELTAAYRELVEEQPAPSHADLPSSLVPHVERYEELSKLSTRELFTRAMEGLAGLEKKLLRRGSPSGMELLVGALARRSDVQDQLRDRRREADWVRETLEAEEVELEALTHKLEWLNQVVDGRDRTVEALERERVWLEESIAAKKVEAEALAKERDQLEQARKDLDEQRRWLETTLRDRDALIEEQGRKEAWLEEVLESEKARAAALEEKERWLSESLEGAQAHLEELAKATEEHERARAALEEKANWLESTVADREATIQDREAAVAERERTLAEFSDRIVRHERVQLELREWIGASRDTIGAFEGEKQDESQRSVEVRDHWAFVLDEVERLLDADEAEVAPDELGERVRALLDELDTEAMELRWRRGEMLWLSERSRSRYVGLLFRLAKVQDRVRDWRPPETGEKES